MAGGGKRKVNATEAANFCSQIELILDAGLPLYDGMETVAETAKGSEYAELYQATYQGLNETGTLYEALKKDERWPEYMTELTGIGEQTGQLQYVMHGLTEYYEREARLRSAIVNAITYPLVLGVMLVVIVLIMVLKVLPVFRRVLGSMGVEMSGAGRTLTQVGSVIGWVVLIVVGLAVVIILVSVLLLRSGARDKVLEVARKLFPPIRKLDLKLNSSRVASVLSIMLSSGIPTLEAFRILPSVLSNKTITDKVNEIYRKLDNGGAFSEAITESGLFGGLDDRMIRIGCATGREEQVMRKIADSYEQQVEDGIEQLVAIIEPTLIALLSIVIGAILLSVMFPMIGILSNAF